MGILYCACILSTEVSAKAMSGCASQATSVRVHQAYSSSSLSSGASVGLANSMR